MIEIKNAMRLFLHAYEKSGLTLSQILKDSLLVICKLRSKDSNRLIDRHKKIVTGFTFIELIISILILAIIIASIYSAFNTGLCIYKKSSTGQDLQKIRAVLLKIDKELKGSFFFSRIPFKGEGLEVMFPLVIVKQKMENTYIVSYYAEKDKDRDFYKLIRKEKLFTDNPQDEKEEIKDMFSAVSIRFEYAYKSNDSSKNYEWQEIWGEEQKALPLAVRISFKIGGAGDIYNKVIFLMQGTLGAK